MRDDASQFTSATSETSVTFLKLNEYIQNTLPVNDEDDAATVITGMVAVDKDEINEEENKDPKGNNKSLPSIKSVNNESVDLVFSGLKSVRPRSSRYTSSSSSSRSSSSSSSSVNKKTSKSRKTKTYRGFNNKDTSLDVVLKRLSKNEPDVPLPPAAAWESKVKYLAGQIDSERDNAVKLADIEAMLERKKIRAKKETEQAKWKSRVTELEAMLEEKKKAKEEKLRKLAVILETLKNEKAETRKYEKPNGGGARGRWSAKSVQTPANRTKASFSAGKKLFIGAR